MWLNKVHMSIAVNPLSFLLVVDHAFLYMLGYARFQFVLLLSCLECRE